MTCNHLITDPNDTNSPLMTRNHLITHNDT